MFTPARERGCEILDDPSVDPRLALRSLRDVTKANRWFGGQQAILHPLLAVLKQMPACSTDAPHTLVDIGTGLGDIPAAAARLAHTLHCPLRTVGIECVAALANAARDNCTHVVAGNALALPFSDHSVDIVTCSQVLHHFDDADATQLLQECTRVARVAVIIGDLRRSWIAIGGLWLSSFALGFHPVSRHDGVVSIRRGYTATELAALINAATGRCAAVNNAWGWRVTATWTPATNSTSKPS